MSPVTGDGSLTQGDAIPLMPNTPDPDTTANFMFRATRYPTDYPGFDGLDLTPSGTVEINTCPADTNFSGVVDVVDLITLLGDWGDCTGLCQGDVTRNGAVDVLDLIEMLQVWGECSAP